MNATRITSRALDDFTYSCARCGRSVKRSSKIAADGLTLCRDCRDYPDQTWMDAILGRRQFRATTDEELAALDTNYEEAS